MEAYIYLVVAILSEVIGTSALKASDGLSRVIPAIFVLFGYFFTVLCLSLALKTLPVGIVYAVWCGLGIVSMVLIGVIVYHEEFGPIQMLGTTLILLGVLLLTLMIPQTT